MAYRLPEQLASNYGNIFLRTCREYSRLGGWLHEKKTCPYAGENEGEAEGYTCPNITQIRNMRVIQQYVVNP